MRSVSLIIKELTLFILLSFFFIFATMNNQNAFLLLNGEPPLELPDLSNYSIVCATDGAYGFFEKNNKTPDFISGDFDSVKKLPDNIEVIHTPNQNFTDFDKALQILFKRGYKTVDVYGASGQEQDHFLGNLHTAILWKDKIKLNFYDNYSSYFLADKQTVINDCNGKTISLMPFPEANNITTKGLQYPLNNEDLSFAARIGTRNAAVENEVVIDFEYGDMFIFIKN